MSDEQLHLYLAPPDPKVGDEVVYLGPLEPKERTDTHKPLTFELLEDDLVPEVHWTEEHPVAKEQMRCLCGRFARYGGDEHYYNGTYDCYRYFIDCTHCGRVTVECV